MRQGLGYRMPDAGYRTQRKISCILYRVSCILFLLISCILHPASGQVYPVQSTLQITPPYSLTLADYVAPGSEKMALNVFLADVNRPELNVRFRLRIEGVGIRIETKAEYLPEPMMINGGVPLRLIGADLVNYFDPRNLNFSGITQREYEQKSALPEGLYQFTFEVIEYNRGVKISNSATVMAWLILNDPPLINLPKDNDKIRIQSPQQVIFQWTPRHTGSPNAAFSTEYEFRLVEVWPSTRNPNDAILTSPAIFETTTAASTLIYGPAETPLEPGRRYAFRIKAKSIVGVDEINLFKNNGYSQVSTFVYGDACTLPTGIQAEAISSSKIGFAWDTQDNHTGYNVKYRLANTPNEAWYTNTSALNDIEINSLQPSTKYEYQVAAACGSYDSEYSAIATVTTKEAQAITYSCGLPLNPFDLDPSQLIESLKTGDVIQAGDFDVKLTEVSGSNGIFTGKGVIEIPFFNKASLQASFSSISVNKQLRMVAGSMNITGGGVEVIPAGVMNAMDQLTEVLALADSALNLVESNLPQPFDSYSFVADKEVKITGTITSVTKGAGGSVVVTASNGTQQTIPAGGTTAITDSSGNGYLVDSKGNIHPTTAAIASAAAHREYNLNVNFAKAQESKFGFDAKKYDALITTYEQVKDNYYAAWKSVATGQTDNVLALLEGTNVDKTKIHFEQSGQSLTPNSQSPTPNTQVLIIKGTADGVEESVVALYTPSDTTQKEQVLGKLNVVTYNQIDKHVVIVPVNGNTFDKFGAVKILQDSLNKIYNQGIVNWTVELKEGITIDGISPFEDGGTGLLSNFTSHMKKVINAYKDNATPDTYYLFLVSNPQDPSTLGVMPRSKEYGFIFADKHNTLSGIARTIAHELGHGAFNLHHTFMEPNYTITKGTTTNLMDYPAGPKLYKYQWDKIRYPDIVVVLFESDEEGQYKYDPSVHFALTPNGKCIDNFYLVENDKETLVNVISQISKSSYAIVSVKYNDLVYTWNEAEQSYKSGSSKIIVKKDNSLPELVNLFQSRDNCIYYYSVVQWTASDERSTDLATTFAGKITQSTSWIPCYLDIRDASCESNFLRDVVNSTLQCSIEDAEKGDLLLSSHLTATDAGVITDVVNAVCLTSLRKLTFDQLKYFLDKVASQSEIKDKSEVAILRLMNALSPNNYPSFFGYLESDKNRLVKKLVAEMDDKWSLFWKGDNWTNFTGALISMYSKNSETYTSRFAELGADKLLTQVLNLNPVSYSSLSSFFLSSNTTRKNSGTYNSESGNVIINESFTTFSNAVYGGIPAGSIGTVDIAIGELSPLDPVIIIPTDTSLPLEQVALSDAVSIGGNQYIVPAIFLHYKGDKEFKDAVETEAMIALDVVTIVSSGGMALATKVTWVRRIWALTEVVGAVGNIGVNTGTIDTASSIGKAVNYYNLGMAVIGVKNLGKGVVDFATKLPNTTKGLLKDNKSIRNLMVSNYIRWRSITTNLDNFSDTEKQLISRQEQVWKALGVVDNLSTAGNTGIKLVDDFLNTLPKIDNLSNIDLPTGYQISIKNGSRYIKRIDVDNLNTPRLMVDETGTIVRYLRPQRLANSAKLRSNLESSLDITAPANHQAHHIVPSNVVENSVLHKEAIRRGLYDVDRAENGKFLAETDEDFVTLSEAYPIHFGSHPNYDAQIRSQIDDVLRANNLTPSSDLSKLSDTQIMTMIEDVEDLSLNVLENWVPSKLN